MRAEERSSMLKVTLWWISPCKTCFREKWIKYFLYYYAFDIINQWLPNKYICSQEGAKRISILLRPQTFEQLSMKVYFTLMNSVRVMIWIKVGHNNARSLIRMRCAFVLWLGQISPHSLQTHTQYFNNEALSVTHCPLLLPTD